MKIHERSIKHICYQKIFSILFFNSPIITCNIIKNSLEAPRRKKNDLQKRDKLHFDNCFIYFRELI